MNKRLRTQCRDASAPRSGQVTWSDGVGHAPLDRIRGGGSIAIASAFLRPAISQALYIAVALMWLVPDPRIEKAVRTS